MVDGLLLRHVGGGGGRVRALLLPELDEMISAAMISDETM